MEMAELGAANYAKILSPAKDLISQRQAYKDFGEARVKRWHNQQVVKVIRNGETSRSKKLYSRAELMAANKAEKINALIHK